MPFKFTGTLNKLQIKLGADGLSPEQANQLQHIQQERALATQ